MVKQVRIRQLLLKFQKINCFYQACMRTSKLLIIAQKFNTIAVISNVIIIVFASIWFFNFKVYAYETNEYETNIFETDIELFTTIKIIYTLTAINIILYAFIFITTIIPLVALVLDFI